MKSGNLNFLEPSGPLPACNGIAFFFNWLQPVLNHLGIPRDIYRGCTVDPIYQFTFKVLSQYLDGTFGVLQSSVSFGFFLKCVEDIPEEAFCFSEETVCFNQKGRLVYLFIVRIIGKS